MMPNNLAGMSAPPSAEGPSGPPTPGGPHPQQDGQQDPSQAHYRDENARCYNCEYFQDPSTCTKGVNGGTVAPEGGCDLFEMADGDGDHGDGPDVGGGAPGGAYGQ